MSASEIVASEPAIRFPKLGEWIAKEYGIPKPHLSTLHRWRLSGSRGHVLASFVVGSRRYVRPEDVRTFIAKIN